MGTIIEVGKSDFDDLQGLLFVADAITTCKHEKRPHQTHIIISGGMAAATDGRRLHCCNLSGKYRTGLYRIINKKGGANGQVTMLRRPGKISDFPKYKHLLMPTEKAVASVNIHKRSKRNWEDVYGIPEFMHHVFVNNAGFNVKYIGDLPQGDWEASIYAKEGRADMAIFENTGTGRAAIVMMMKV